MMYSIVHCCPLTEVFWYPTKFFSMSLTMLVWSLPVVNSRCEMVNRRLLYITADETENDDYITCTCI